jgi:hypothetical protein
MAAQAAIEGKMPTQIHYPKMHGTFSRPFSDGLLRLTPGVLGHFPRLVWFLCSFLMAQKPTPRFEQWAYNRFDNRVWDGSMHSFIWNRGARADLQGEGQRCGEGQPSGIRSDKTD